MLEYTRVQVDLDASSQQVERARWLLEPDSRRRHGHAVAVAIAIAIAAWVVRLDSLVVVSRLSLYTVHEQ